MKSEIINLINSEKGTLKINQFCTLKRWTKDALGHDVDALVVYFSIIAHSEYHAEVKSRDWREIVNEISATQTQAFSETAEKLNRNLLNGYID